MTKSNDEEFPPPVDPRSADRLLSKELLQRSLQDPRSVDRLLSKELLQLSLKDRRAIDEEIHGVSTLAPTESPAFLESALAELAEELRSVPDHSPAKAAYIESQVLPRTYVNTPGFRLRFLRYELFDAKKAAYRLLKFLDHASDLFGPEVLERPIRMTDFTKQEEQLMQLGFLQLLPYRDRTGRPVYAWVGVFDVSLLQAAYKAMDGTELSARSVWKRTARLRHKITLYQHYCMSNDVETQQKGFVMLCFPGFQEDSSTFPLWAMDDWEFNKTFFEASPLRWCVVHWCLPNKPRFKVLRSALAIFAGNPSQSQLRLHYGEIVELLYDLKTFGIPVEAIPVTFSGTIKASYLKQWIRGQKFLEHHDASIVVYPRSNDVLFRKGTTLACHPGNSRFQELVESIGKDHSAASKKEKNAITNSIIDTVRRRDGRFLQWNARGWWTEIEERSQIYTKVANQVKLFKFKSVPVHRSTHRGGTTLFQNQDNGKRRKISGNEAFGSESGSNNCGGCCG